MLETWEMLQTAPWQTIILYTASIVVPLTLVLAVIWLLIGRVFASSKVYTLAQFTLGSIALLFVWIGSGFILYGILGGMLSPSTMSWYSPPPGSLQAALDHFFHRSHPLTVLTIAILAGQLAILVIRLVKDRQRPSIFSLPMVFAVVNVVFLTVYFLALGQMRSLPDLWQVDASAGYLRTWPSILLTFVVIGLTYLAEWKVVPPFFLAKPTQ